MRTTSLTLPVSAVALLAGAVLAGPAASAASAAASPELVGGPLALGKLGRFPGYRMVVAAQENGPGRLVVVVQFVRTKGRSAQTIGYSFDLPGSALRTSHNLDEATLDTGSGMGRFGRIRMTFACRRRKAGRRPPCLGSRRHRPGKLTGLLDVRTEFGGRVRGRMLPAKLVLKQAPLTNPIPGASPSCKQHPHSAALAVGPVAGDTSHNFVLGGFLAVRQRSGPVRLLVGVIRTRPPATENAGIQSTVRRSALRLVGTRTARVDALGAPFFAGRLDFSRAAPFPGCPGRAAVGTATGSMRARFDFFGTVAVVKTHRNTPAILIRPAAR